MKRFTITDVDWKEFPCTLKNLMAINWVSNVVVFEDPIERKECGYGDDKFCFTSIAS